MPQKKKKDKRHLLPPAIRKGIAKGVTIKKVTRTKLGIRVEGENAYQNFVEYWSPRGKIKGSILQNKRVPFWSVWNERQQVVTKNIGKGRSLIIGSKTKKGALRKLHKRMK